MFQPFQNALSDRKGTVFACVMLLVLAPTPAPGLTELERGNQPLSNFNDAAWPGLLAVVNDASRVLFALPPTPPGIRVTYHGGSRVTAGFRWRF